MLVKLYPAKLHHEGCIGESGSILVLLALPHDAFKSWLQGFDGFSASLSLESDIYNAEVMIQVVAQSVS